MKNNHGMKTFAWNGPVMNEFVNNSAGTLIWVMSGPVMNVFLERNCCDGTS